MFHNHVFIHSLKFLYLSIFCLLLVACDEESQSSSALSSLPSETMDMTTSPIQDNPNTEFDSDASIDELDQDNSESPVDSMDHQGELSIQYSSPFLLDNFQSRDPEYLSMQQQYIQSTPAFFGRIGDRLLSITGEDDVLYEVFGLQAGDQGLVALLQMSFDAKSNQPISPFIQLALDPDLVSINEPYSISSNERKARIMLFHVNSDLSLKCVSHLGFGELLVTQASDLQASQGGSIEVSGSSIKLYTPQNTPLGDLSDLLIEEGKSICTD